MIWLVRFLNLALAVTLLTLSLTLTYPPPTGCIIPEVYGIGENKITEPLPCEWAGFFHRI